MKLRYDINSVNPILLVIFSFIIIITPDVFYSMSFNLNKPDNSFKMNFQNQPNSDDSSDFSSDGPIIVYENGNIVSYSIIPADNNFEVKKESINSKDKLTCIIDETGQRFDFQLKDSIHVEKDEYELPNRMLIISDIEGNFKGFEVILKAAGVINEKFNWTFGNGHLVLAGDFFDRGINVTECLWLIYKLESEAEQQGGKVHFILGNHEVMNLRKDFRYVRRKYLVNADSLKLNYQSWYDVNTELGKWLRSKNAVEKIGDFLFLHAGINKSYPAESLTINEINNNIRVTIDKSFEKGEASKDNFIGSKGPLWYRGIIKEEESQQDIDQTLSFYDASKMILGHTIVDKMKYMFNKKIIAIDIDHQENSENGIMYALYFENGNFYIIDNNGIKEDLQ